LTKKQVAKCIEIGLLCQETDPSKRPSIHEVIHDIREMDSVNGTISNAWEIHTFGQISPYPEADMLEIEPLELHLPFELNQQMSNSLQLTNETGSHIAFNVKNMSSVPYCLEPHKGIVPPGSNCNVCITLKPLYKAPRDASEFIVLSTKVNSGLTAEDITTDMFNKDTDNVVDEVNLYVILAPPLQKESGRFHQAFENINEVIPTCVEFVDILEKYQDGSNAKSFTYNLKVLKVITNNFAIGSQLGKDEYGVIYKGVLPSGKNIVMRELSQIHLMDPPTFQNVMSYLTRIKHQNVVRFLGSCVESGWEWTNQPSGSSIWVEVPKRLVCSEYENIVGSLDKYMYGTITLHYT